MSVVCHIQAQTVKGERGGGGGKGEIEREYIVTEAEIKVSPEFTMDARLCLRVSCGMRGGLVGDTGGEIERS